MPRLEISDARFTATVILPERAATFATLMTARIRFRCLLVTHPADPTRNSLSV